MADPRFARLPSVHALVDAALRESSDLGAPTTIAPPRWAVVEAARQLVGERRAAILGGGEARPEIAAAEVRARAAALARPSLRRVVNATGVVLHTNLGRAPLAPSAVAAIAEAAAHYANLEYDLATGERGSRHDHLRAMLVELTGAEDAIVVNNNAAATTLGLAALGSSREIVVSRGELIEIGGSFRLPEILALSGGTLVEVGTTNKTHAKDYERAISDRTALFLKVHRSNFAIVGFTAEVSIADLVVVGRARGIPTMVDLGSGALVDRATQRAWQLPDEPTIQEVVAAGADLVTFSGDKLLGGPQAGIAVGTRAAIAACRAHPLMRAIRPDKLVLAGLHATLALYRAGTPEAVPVLGMLARTDDELAATAARLAARLVAAGIAARVERTVSTVGGGAMPTAHIPSWAVTVVPSKLVAVLRNASIPVVARVEDGRIWLDVRTLTDADDHDAIFAALAPTLAV